MHVLRSHCSPSFTDMLQELGHLDFDATLGEVWLEETKGLTVATRNFSTTAGTVVTYKTSNSEMVSAVPDKYNGISVSPNGKFVLTPDGVDTSNVDLYSTETGDLVWQWNHTGGKLVGVTSGDTTAVVSWVTATDLVFDILKTTHAEKPHAATVKIPIPSSDPSYEVAAFQSSLSADDTVLALGINGAGAYLIDLTEATPKATHIYKDVDTCGFQKLEVAVGPDGKAVVVAAENQRESANTCLGGGKGLVGLKA